MDLLLEKVVLVHEATDFVYANKKLLSNRLIYLNLVSVRY